MERWLSMEARRELTEAVRERYRAAGRTEKKRILDEFAELAGYHRRHAVRVLKGGPKTTTSSHGSERRVYDEAVVMALRSSGKLQTGFVASGLRRCWPLLSSLWRSTDISVWKVGCANTYSE